MSTALNILEKYGCNLTNPNRPKYWRTVKHNNPVFRATVDAIQVKIHRTYHNAYDGNHVVVTVMAVGKLKTKRMANNMFADTFIPSLARIAVNFLFDSLLLYFS